MSNPLESSFEFCRRLTRREAGNFYFSFLTLPQVKRDAMCAIYAWMRRLDDLADDAPSPTQARSAVEEWRKQTHHCLQSSSPPQDPQPASANHPSALLWLAFADTVHRYKIPHSHFDEISEGALMDQEISRYATFDELYRYCYRVASVVGLVCLRVFEYTDKEAEQTGEWLGISFQLTNILRDVREDAGRGRIYLPLEELKKHGVSEQDVLDGRWSDGMHALLRSFAERTESYYDRAHPVVRLVSGEARPTLRIMTEIYHGILNEIKNHHYRVFDHRARVPTWKKMAIVLKHQVLPA